MHSSLVQRIEAAGEEPWLFFLDTWEWRWWSWREAWRRAEALQRQWQRSKVELHGRGVLFGPLESQQMFVVDLAILLSGGIPVPQGPPEARGAAQQPARLSDAPARCPQGPSHGVCSRLLRVDSKDGESIAALPGGPPPPGLTTGGDILPASVVWQAEAGPEAIAIDRLQQFVEALKEALNARRPARWLSRFLGLPQQRPTAVDVSGLVDPASRVGWAWSLCTGAALLLAPSRADWLRSVLWARPTHLWAECDQLTQLTRACARKRAHRRSMGRLSTIAIYGESDPRLELEKSDHEVLRRLGVSTVPHPLSARSRLTSPSEPR